MTTPFGSPKLIASTMALSLMAAHVYAGAIQDDLRYDFDANTQGWGIQVISPPFDVPNANALNGFLNINSVNNTNTFGSWESPAALVPIPAAAKDDKGDIIIPTPDVFLMTARIESNVESKAVTPNFRMRTFYPSFHQTSVMTVESVGDASYTPPVTIMLREGENSQEKILPIDISGKRYNYYFDAPTGIDTFKHAFDLLNFSGLDQADGGLSLDYLAINRVSEPQDPLILDLLDCTTQTDQDKFTNFNALGVDSPFRIRNSQGMSLSGELGVIEFKDEERGGGTPAWVFGGYTTTFQNPIVADRDYKLDVTMGATTSSETVDQLPTFRIRVNDSSFQASWYLNVDSLGANPTLPSQGQDKTYSLFFSPRSELAGNDLIFSLDYLWVNGDGNSLTKSIIMKEVKLISTSLNIID